MKQLKFLLTNDDGIDASGLKYLRESVQCLGDIFVVAPSEQQSGKATGVTFNGPLYVQSVNSHENATAWKVNGTPSGNGHAVRLDMNGTWTSEAISQPNAFLCEYVAMKTCSVHPMTAP